MNNVRFLGIVIFLMGAAGMYLYVYDLTGFISGILVACGIIFVLNGKITKERSIENY